MAKKSKEDLEKIAEINRYFAQFNYGEVIYDALTSGEKVDAIVFGGIDFDGDVSAICLLPVEKLREVTEHLCVANFHTEH